MFIREILLEYQREKTLELLSQAILSRAQNDPTAMELGVEGDELVRMVLVHFEEADPTDQKSYVVPLLRMYIRAGKDGSSFFLEDLYKATHYLERFEELKHSGFFRRNPEFARQADIGSFKTLADLGEFVLTRQPHDAISNNAQERALEQGFISKGEVEIVYNDADYKIVIPHTKEAAQFFGRNTQWCTSAHNKNKFAQYNRQGPLYIILDKANNRRWQFHGPSSQYMDENDRRVLWKDFPIDIIRRCPQIISGPGVSTLAYAAEDWGGMPPETLMEIAPLLSDVDLATATLWADNSSWKFKEVPNPFLDEVKKRNVQPKNIASGRSGRDGKVTIYDFGDSIPDMVLWCYANIPEENNIKLFQNAPYMQDKFWDGYNSYAVRYPACPLNILAHSDRGFWILSGPMKGNRPRTKDDYSGIWQTGSAKYRSSGGSYGLYFQEDSDGEVVQEYVERNYPKLADR